MSARPLSSGIPLGNVPSTRRFEAILAKETGALRGLRMFSCAHALEMVALLLDMQSEDEVILPPFTFVSAANAFVLRGVVPVFCDIPPDTLNIDETLVEGLIRQLKELGIAAVFHYLPLHLSPLGLRVQLEQAPYHVPESISDQSTGMPASVL